MIDNLKNNKLLLGIAIVLVSIGLLKPDITSIINPKNDVVINDATIDVKKPTDQNLLDACSEVVNAIKAGPNTRVNDGKKLSSLYRDLASLIQLDGDNAVIKSTLEIREANRLSGLLCRLNLSGKYPGLSEACNNVVVAGLGDSEMVLDEATRQKAVEVFMALSWACLEGSK